MKNVLHRPDNLTPLKIHRLADNKLAGKSISHVQTLVITAKSVQNVSTTVKCFYNAKFGNIEMDSGISESC